MKKEEQLQFGGDFVTVSVPLPEETDKRYARIARHIRYELKLEAFPKDIIMAAVLASPMEADLVIGFLDGGFEVVSQSKGSLNLLHEALLTVEEGRLEFGTFELKRETRSATGKTSLEEYKESHPDLLREVEKLPREKMVDLVMEYLRTRESARGILPRLLQALAEKHPNQYAAAVNFLKQAVADRAKIGKFAYKQQQGPRQSPRLGPSL